MTAFQPAIARVVAASLLSLAACAHTPRAAVMGPAAEERCEEAAVALVARPPHPASDELRRVATAPAAWLLTGAGYAADMTVLVGLCLPVIALDASTHGHGDASARCVGEMLQSFAGKVPSFGDATAEATLTWRCLDRTAELGEVRSAAACFARRDWPGDHDVARTLLLRYQQDRSRLSCTPRRERQALERALAELTPEAEPVPPGEAPPNDPGLPPYQPWPPPPEGT